MYPCDENTICSPSSLNVTYTSDAISPLNHSSSFNPLLHTKICEKIQRKKIKQFDHLQNDSTDFINLFLICRSLSI